MQTEASHLAFYHVPTMFHHHFLLIAYPAQGHINPALQLAKRLIALGAHVTLSTTVHMHRRMTKRPTIPALSFAPFSDGYDDGLKATGNDDYTLYASEFTRRGSEFVTNLIASSAREGHPFTCLVHTILLQWAAQAARGFHLPTAMLWVQPATVLDIIYYYFHGYGDYINNKIEEPSGSVELPGLPLVLETHDLPSYFLPQNSSVYSLILPLFEEQFHDLDEETSPIVLVNTFEALEPEALRAVDKFNIISIGPLIPSAFLDENDPTDTSFGGDIFHASNDYVEWLGSKPEKSVVYVSFGSFCVLSKKQMEEIARALLDSGHPFLWVIREKEKKGEEAKEKLQEKEKAEEEEEDEELSCREELEERGKIVEWCSQVEVLSHPSLGCFVTHCGWNSTLESIASGVPVVAFPQWVDQKTNAKLIEDGWKTGVRVDNKVNGEGIVQADEFRRCLEVVLGSGEKGVELRGNAKKWKGLAREAVKESGSSEKNLRAFLDDVGQ